MPIEPCRRYSCSSRGLRARHGQAATQAPDDAKVGHRALAVSSRHCILMQRVYATIASVMQYGLHQLGNQHSVSEIVEVNRPHC